MKTSKNKVYVVYPTIWGVEPVVTHQTSMHMCEWCARCNRTKLAGTWLNTEPDITSLVVWAQQEQVLTCHDAVKKVFRK